MNIAKNDNDSFEIAMITSFASVLYVLYRKVQTHFVYLFEQVVFFFLIVHTRFNECFC